MLESSPSLRCTNGLPSSCTKRLLQAAARAYNHTHRISANATSRTPSSFACALLHPTNPPSAYADGHVASKSMGWVTRNARRWAHSVMYSDELGDLRLSGNEGERKCCSLAWIGNGPSTSRAASRACQLSACTTLARATTAGIHMSWTLTSHSRDNSTFHP